MPDRSRHARLVESVADAIAHADERAGAAVEALRSAEAPARRGAATALGFSSDRASLTALRAALREDADDTVRVMAAQSLMLRDDRESMPAVVDLVKSLVARRDRAALDLVQIAAGSLVQLVSVGSIGATSPVANADVQSVRAAMRAAVDVADELRSRHRKEFRAMLAIVGSERL
jgi:HEAT repeat protein